MASLLVLPDQITFPTRQLGTSYIAYIGRGGVQGQPRIAKSMPISPAVRQTGFCQPAIAGSKIAPDLPQSNPNAMIDVIVKYKTPATKDELKQLGAYGQIKKIYSVINGVNVTLSVSTIQQIQSDPLTFSTLTRIARPRAQWTCRRRLEHTPRLVLWL